jgi:hypothetical protein
VLCGVIIPAFVFVRFFVYPFGMLCNISRKESCGCADEPSASIDSGIGISIVLGVVLGIMILLKLKN